MRKTIHNWYLLFLCLMPIWGHTEIPKTNIPPQMSIESRSAINTGDKVLFLIQKRLSLMHEVARWKWNAGAAIEDLAREAEILEKMGVQFETLGVDKAWGLEFLQAQMDAAKMIQRRDFEIWIDEGTTQFERPLDLAKEIRPFLDSITLELMEKISKAGPLLSNPGLRCPSPLLMRPCDSLDEDVWLKATDPLYRYPSQF